MRILARKEFPEIVNYMTLHVGCVAGASQIADYEEHLQRAGFQDTPTCVLYIPTC